MSGEDRGDLLLPAGTRLLHIGPQKTGTTTLQSAFHANRPALREHGVHYAGRLRQPRDAAAAVVFGRVMPGHAPDSMDRWPELVEEVATSDADRVVISAEMFADSTPEVARTVVEAFGREQTHVVITARALGRLLPSQWQQYVQSGLRRSYPDWLQDVLAPDGSRGRGDRFWHRHRHDRLALRWAEAVGQDHVTVVALDEARRGMNLRVFEQMLGLPDGLLVPPRVRNRSFTLPEIELIREINHQFAAEGWPRASFERGLRFGMDSYLKDREPDPDEPAIRTPAWAVARADEVAAEIVEGLRGSGVRVVGDLDALRVVDADPPQDAGESAGVTNAVAARAALGVLRATEISPTKLGGHVSRDVDRPRRRRAGRAEPTTPDLLRMLARRGRGRVSRLRRRAP